MRKKQEPLDLSSSPWGAPSVQNEDCEHAIVSPAEFNAAGGALLSRNSAKTSSLTRTGSLDGSSEAYRKGTSSPQGLGRTGSQGKEGSGGMEEPFQTTVYEQAFTYKGTKVRAKSTPNILSWKPVSSSSVFCDRSSKCRKIPYDEILSAWQMPSARSCQIGLCPSEYALVIYAVGRKRGQPSKWHLEEHHLIATSLEQVKDWAAIVNSSLQKCHHRPKNLLVLINPFSGAKRSRIVWEQKARPVFEKAHIKYALVETLQADHAREMIAKMKPDELMQYQGIVAVGGDGVFQECIMGLMEQRALGGANLAAAARIRVGHIPGGSTDAVACSLHGTRCAETAALHVALGDRLALDVATIVCQPSAQELRARARSNLASHPISINNPPPLGGLMVPPHSSEGTEEQLPHSIGASEAEDAFMMSSTTDRGASHKHTSSCSMDPHGTTHKGGLGSQSGPQGSAHSTKDAGAAGPGSGLANRLSCRNFVCQAAYGYFGDVMCASEGLRFMGPSRYDFSGFLQLVKLQSYRLQIMYKPAAQSLRADAQDVCSHKCEVCRLAGLSLLEHTQGASELTTPLSSPSKAPPSGNNPRPPLPPSLHIPASPNMPRGQSHRSPSRPNSNSTLVNNPSYQREGSQSSSPTKHASDPRLHPLLPPLHPTSPSRSPTTNPADPHATTGRRTDAAATGAAASSGRVSGSGAGVQAGGEREAGMGGQGHQTRGAGGGRGGGDSPGRVSPSEGSANALLGAGEDGPGSVARQLLEQSGVNPRDARTGCSAEGMTRQQQGWNGGPMEGGWVSMEGEFVSVMVVATPCRSDMTKKGIVPNAHLSDGRLYLILVSSCNRLDYLRFLIRLSSKGLEDGCFPFVKIVPVTGVVINPLPPPPTSPLYANTLAKCCPPPDSLHICPGESAWNVDGELLPHNAVRIGITRGAVDVFARGVELVPPSL